MKKSSKGTNPCGYTESVSKSKSRIKKFEQCNARGENHRLANTYANNQPGDVPPNPSYMKSVDKRHKEGMSWIGQKLDSLDKAINPFRQAADAMKSSGEAVGSSIADIGQKAHDEAVKRGQR